MKNSELSRRDCGTASESQHMAVPEEESRKNIVRNRGRNFPHFMRPIRLHIQEPQQTPSQMNTEIHA